MFKSKPPLWKIILTLWVIFSIGYVGYTQYQYFQKYVYEKGVTDAVTKLMQHASKCEAFPVQLGEQQAQLINVACLTKPTESAKAEEEKK